MPNSYCLLFLTRQGEEQTSGSSFSFYMFSGFKYKGKLLFTSSLGIKFLSMLTKRNRTLERKPDETLKGEYLVQQRPAFCTKTKWQMFREILKV